jgi:hypothetical protein
VDVSAKLQFAEAERNVKSRMMFEESAESTANQLHLTSSDVESMLRERGWLDEECTPEIEAWCAEAAALLGRQAALQAQSESEAGAPPATSREALAELLALVFHYDARAVLATPEAHAVLARAGARDVIRALAHEVLDAPEIDSDRLREIVERLKQQAGFAGRQIFHPLRLVLAGRVGEGELDRVILLLDRAARLPFRAPVKGTRQRVLEFCSALD